MSRQSQCPNGLGISFLPLIFSLLLALVVISHAEAQTCVQPPSDLVSWWPGDGNADDIKNGNDGTLEGDATFVAGMVGQAFSFDGTGDFVVEVPDPGNDSPLHFTGPFTIDLWVKPNTATSTGGMVSKYDFTNSVGGRGSALLSSRHQTIGALWLPTYSA